MAQHQGRATPLLRSRLVRSIGLLGIAAIAAGSIASACSSGTPSSSPSTTGQSTSSSAAPTSTTSGQAAACTSANESFNTWLKADHAASDAETTLVHNWTTYFNSTGSTMPSPSSSSYTSAVNQFNSEHSAAESARNTANQDLAKYQSDLSKCDTSTLSATCKQDFNLHQQGIQLDTQLAQAYQASVQAITSQQSAINSGDVTSVNNATSAYNSASTQFNSATDSWNTWYRQHQSAGVSCT